MPGVSTCPYHMLALHFVATHDRETFVLPLGTLATKVTQVDTFAVWRDGQSTRAIPDSDLLDNFVGLDAHFCEVSVRPPPT